MTSVTSDRRFGVNGGLAFKAPVRVATTANIALSGLQTIDGVTVAADDRVLVKNQTTASENGLYDASSGSWTRCVDANGNRDFVEGTAVFVTNGSTLAATYWYVTTDNPITIGTSSISWSRALASELSTLSFLQGGSGAVLRSAQDKLREGAMVSVKDFGAVGDGVTNDYAAIVAAYTYTSNVFFPNGTYTIGNNTLTPPVDFCMVGQSRRGVMLTRTGSGPIITTAINTVDPYIRNIYFIGSGNTGITVASTAGANQGYLIRPHIADCDFAWELAYGINADLIYGEVDRCTFGYYGTVGGAPAAGTSTMVGLRSHAYPATTNNSNINRVASCNFRCGSLTAAACDLNGGVGWEFNNNDFSFGGVAISASSITILKFTGVNWFEGNSATGAIIVIGACSVPVDMAGMYFSDNTAARQIEYATSVTAGLNIRDSVFAFSGTSGFPIYDSTTVSNLLPSNGSVAWHGNSVTNGSTSNFVVTRTEFRGGGTSPRFTGVFGSSSPEILACSDPNLTISRNGAGDISLTASHPLSVSTSGIRAVVTGRTGIARALVVNTSQIRLQGFVIGASSSAAEDVFMVSVYGSSV